MLKRFDSECEKRGEESKWTPHEKTLLMFWHLKQKFTLKHPLKGTGCEARSKTKTSAIKNEVLIVAEH